MMSASAYRVIRFLVALVWLINGIFCKVLHLVPRHEAIVAAILGNEYAPILTIAIGASETAMGFWILSGYKSRINTVLQMIVVASMNILEYTLTPELLLWGKFNILFAFLFIAIVYCNEFIFRPKPPMNT